MNFKKPTNKMIEYMQILFNDTGFSIAQRNAWLSDLFKRRIQHLDELLITEGHLVIDKLKELKEDKSKFKINEEIEF